MVMTNIIQSKILSDSSPDKLLTVNISNGWGKRHGGWGEGRGEGGKKGEGVEGGGGRREKGGSLWGTGEAGEGWRGSNFNYCIITFVIRCIFLTTLTELSGPFLPK